MGGVAINGLDEWDVSRLGWLKVSTEANGGDHIDSSAAVQIRQSVTVGVKDCVANEYSAETSVLDTGQQVSYCNILKVCPCPYYVTFVVAVGQRPARHGPVPVRVVDARLAPPRGGIARRVAARLPHHPAQEDGREGERESSCQQLSRCTFTRPLAFFLSLAY